MSDVQTHRVASARVPLLRSSFGRTSGVISFGQDRLRSFFGPSEGVISLGQDPVQCPMSKPIMWLRPGSPFSGPPLVIHQESSPSAGTVSGPPLALLKEASPRVRIWCNVRCPNPWRGFGQGPPSPVLLWPYIRSHLLRPGPSPVLL